MEIQELLNKHVGKKKGFGMVVEFAKYFMIPKGIDWVNAVNEELWYMGYAIEKTWIPDNIPDGAAYWKNYPGEWQYELIHMDV